MSKTETQKDKAENTRDQIRQMLDQADSAEKLLEQLWLDLGPYGGGKIKIETVIKLQKHFNFDDSE